MTLWRLALQSLRFHRRSHLGVLFGATLATAIITGALAVGDSVRYSLRQMALARIGAIDLALYNPGRFFRAKLADNLAADLGAIAEAAIILPGTATVQRTDGTGGDVRINRVQVVGVADSFWRFKNALPKKLLVAADGGAGVALNQRLADALKVKIGDDVLLRVDKPSLLSRDAPLSTIEDATVTLRAPVTYIVSDSNFGRFSLEANQTPPYNAFLSREAIQKLIGMEARANALLVGRGGENNLSPAEATSALWKRWQFTDSGLEVRNISQPGVVELRTNRVFLDPPVGDAARKAMPGAQGVLTYFVNELRVGEKATPYSTVAAMDPMGGPPSPPLMGGVTPPINGGLGGLIPSHSVVPPGMREEEILVNQWFADDVGAKVGDTVNLKYWLVGPMRKLEEHTAPFTIRAILPMGGAALDRDLMPDIPGLSDKKNCREWEPGIPVDLKKLRDKDQAYWDAYRGTPKAFITLRAGQRIWNNRFGNLTAVRYSSGGVNGAANVEACLRQALNPASQGLFFSPVRERALAASSDSLDFGQLFLGFSFFLIIAALLLTALLFAFGVEQRTEEIGTLLALGFSPRRVQGLLLLEGGAIAVLAGILGVLLATLYTRAVVGGLSTIWGGAVANSLLQFHAEPTTLLIGGLSGVLMALLSIFLVTRRQGKVPARELLASGSESESRLLSASSKSRFLPGLPTMIISLILAAGLAIAVKFSPADGGAEMQAGLFFGVGALLLIAGIAACRGLLALWERNVGGSALTLASLGSRNAFRRIGRSLGAIALLACGSFLVIAVGANRHDPNDGATRRNSGTGGFALYGESSLPVYQDLNSAEGRDAYGMDAQDLTGTNIVALRLREGDDASCLNLNRAQTPRLMGVPVKALSERGAFTFAETKGEFKGSAWNLIDREEADGTIPVIGDTNTVAWSLGKKLGDTLDYADDRGNVHKLRIVGVLASSILQGGLLLSESNFTRLFPSNSGYRIFLMDAPPATAPAISATLTKGLEDVGLSVLPAPERLAAFNTVENTYLSIFAILGGLGLLLGTLGLGVIVLRNVLERRGELATLRAIGFRSAALQTLVFREHALLLTLGLTVGILAALIAVLPTLRSPGADVPYATLALTLLAVFAAGFLSAYLATRLALRSPLLSALRNE